MFNKNIGDLDQVEEECFNNENEVLDHAFVWYGTGLWL